MISTQYLISDPLWGKIEQLLPIHKTNHPLGTERVTLNYITHVQSRAEEEDSLKQSADLTLIVRLWSELGID